MKPDSLRERALLALSKPAAYGPDIDVSEYIEASETGGVEEALGRLGIGERELTTAASYVQVNMAALQAYMAEGLARMGVVLMPIEEALEKRPEARKYYWGLIPVDADKYTALAELYRSGVYIYVPPGVRVEAPVYTCYVVSAKKALQPVHNVVVVGEGAELNLVTACSSTVSGLHVGVTEIYAERDARITYTMIHHWSSDAHVRPRTVVRLGEGASMESYYVNLSPGRTLQTFPKYILGRGARLYSASVMLASGDSIVDLGSAAVIEGRGGRAELVSKTIARDNARVVNRIVIEARAPESRGHTECSALLLGEEASVRTIPELESSSPDAELSHEAAIGKLDEEAIAYLMARGLAEEEAVSLLVRGFASIEIGELPRPIKNSLRAALKTLAQRATG